MTAKVYYFDGRGKAEVVRLTLAAAGIQFTEELLTSRNQMLSLIEAGDKLLFNQLPMLEIDGKRVTQTGAIVRYLARKGGLLGKNEDENLLIDQIYEGGRDFYVPALPICFKPESDVLDGIKTLTLPKYMPIFEKIAAQNGTGYLVGKSVTIADISVLEALLVYVDYFGKDIFTDYPALKKFYDTLTSESRIDEYLKGPQRKRKNDSRYVDDVQTVLGRK